MLVFFVVMALKLDRSHANFICNDDVEAMAIVGEGNEEVHNVVGVWAEF